MKLLSQWLTHLQFYKKAMNEQSICPLPWIHLSANQDQTLRICCNTDNGGFIRDDAGKKIFLTNLSSINDFFNNFFMKNLRRQMLLGERPEICRQCHRVEDAGGESLRMVLVKQHKELLNSLVTKTHSDGFSEPHIRYIDFALSNHCNLKCRMCSPGASHKLSKDWDVLAWKYDKLWAARSKDGWKNKATLIKIFKECLPHCDEMLTTGGEPFLSLLHQELLEKAIQSGRSSNISLRYHTNLTVLPPKLLSLWEHFRRIEVHCSIEAVGELNDYIRYPSTWQTVDKNLRKLVALKARLPIELEVHTCLQAYSFPRLTSLLSYLLEFKNDLPPFPYMIWLNQPNVLRPTVLPMEVKQQSIEQIENFLNKNKKEYELGPYAQFSKLQIKNLRGYFNVLLNQNDSHLFVQFLNYSKSLDRLRNQNLFDFLPELKGLSETCSTATPS